MSTREVQTWSPKKSEIMIFLKINLRICIPLLCYFTWSIIYAPPTIGARDTCPGTLPPGSLVLQKSIGKVWENRSIIWQWRRLSGLSVGRGANVFVKKRSQSGHPDVFLDKWRRRRGPGADRRCLSAREYTFCLFSIGIYCMHANNYFITHMA